jgi:UDP-2-acetamido-3-amino-2,3-dideoxy-glucuronate N-acetyltransferase
MVRQAHHDSVTLSLLVTLSRADLTSSPLQYLNSSTAQQLISYYQVNHEDIMSQSINMEETKQKRIAVIGAGRWGKNHIKTLHELGFLSGIVEADPDTRNVFKDKYPEAKTFATIRDAIKEDFDGFTVATPAETHFKIAEFIITHKKHVLVEKPLTLKASEARRLKELAEENGVNLMVGHLLLFHPAIRKIKELIKKGKIGRLEYIYSNRLNLGTVRTEENILWSFAPHDISVFQYFIGSLPSEIVSRGGVFLQPHNHDSSMTILTYRANLRDSHSGAYAMQMSSEDP